jgi:hypothetical protein
MLLAPATKDACLLRLVGGADTGPATAGRFELFKPRGTQQNHFGSVADLHCASTLNPVFVQQTFEHQQCGSGLSAAATVPYACGWAGTRRRMQPWGMFTTQVVSLHVSDHAHHVDCLMLSIPGCWCHRESQHGQERAGPPAQRWCCAVPAASHLC